ncbi:MAG TPA: DNA alkylation repair protein [Verrucomicrobiota bacterium]|nr:DNA alkylation repair protein [Verrucomicrobiales bacterium]HRI11473.1 DNA alkylation repair protein [Verrucomicrobiota bacterium]
MAASEAPALKEWFDANRFRQVTNEIRAIYPAFDTVRFLGLALPGLETLTLMQRLRRMTESLKATLPSDYRKTLSILRQFAPRIDHDFVTLVLPDYVGQYGLDDFDLSLEALEFFTTFGSSEFAVREFLRRDLKRTLAVMERWSRSENESVRRLASEGCRPRLPWSFHLEALIADPSPVAPILENLKTDPSLYVRKSVANHLNDITRDHPGWVLDRLARWPRENPHTAWITKRALRTLIKKGDRRALAVIGAGDKPKVAIRDLQIRPQKITLGDQIRLSFRLESKSIKAQRLVVDYTLHYVKKSGGTSAKVFKLKELTLAPGESVSLARVQRIRDFTTRVHHPGRHQVQIMVNGESLAKDAFYLSRRKPS